MMFFTREKLYLAVEKLNERLEKRRALSCRDQEALDTSLTGLLVEIFRTPRVTSARKSVLKKVRALLDKGAVSTFTDYELSIGLGEFHDLLLEPFREPPETIRFWHAVFRELVMSPAKGWATNRFYVGNGGETVPWGFVYFFCFGHSVSCSRKIDDYSRVKAWKTLELMLVCGRALIKAGLFKFDDFPAMFCYHKGITSGRSYCFDGTRNESDVLCCLTLLTKASEIVPLEEECAMYSSEYTVYITDTPWEPTPNSNDWALKPLMYDLALQVEGLRERLIGRESISVRSYKVLLDFYSRSKAKRRDLLERCRLGNCPSLILQEQGFLELCRRRERCLLKVLLDQYREQVAPFLAPALEFLQSKKCTGKKHRITAMVQGALDRSEWVLVGKE